MVHHHPVRLYTATAGISTGLLIPLLQYGLPQYEWVTAPELADYFVLPCNYEVGHELSDYYLAYFNGMPEDRKKALDAESQLTALSKQMGRQLIVFFFSDSNEKIAIDNAIVFRTSMLASQAGKNEYTMPAFRSNQPVLNRQFKPLPWTDIPSVGFRGQAMPMRLSGSKAWKNAINIFSNYHWKQKLFKLNAIDGYLIRRNAVSILSKQKNIQCNFAITSVQDIHAAESVQLFEESVISNPYTLCVVGIGNYSYRLYEVLSAGRIPVFINTDCKLPFEDMINWTHHLVWIEDWQIPDIGKILFEFHQQHKGDAFFQLQQQNQALWKQYLSTEGFLSHIVHYLR